MKTGINMVKSQKLLGNQPILEEITQYQKCKILSDNVYKKSCNQKH